MLLMNTDSALKIEFLDLFQFDSKQIKFSKYCIYHHIYSKLYSYK